jgi:hypothetical protein
MANVLASCLPDEDVSALVNAYWSEFILEKYLGDRCLAPEASHIAQVQLTLHQLERAKLEVEVYSEAITKVIGLSVGTHVTRESSRYNVFYRL